MNKILRYSLILISILIVCGVFYFSPLQPLKNRGLTGAPIVENKSNTIASLTLPIIGGLERVTKKTFGLQVSPSHSPVYPEKFTGYHTGIDFETFTDDQDTEITIQAICTGPIVLRKWATGYGGVVVQKCIINNQDVTVVYGHLNIASVVTPLRAILKAGETLGVLGKGFSSETDGERKHLHLGIHKGPTVNIAGYTDTLAELKQWADPLNYFN